MNNQWGQGLYSDIAWDAHYPSVTHCSNPLHPHCVSCFHISKYDYLFEQTLVLCVSNGSVMHCPLRVGHGTPRHSECHGECRGLKAQQSADWWLGDVVLEHWSDSVGTFIGWFSILSKWLRTTCQPDRVTRGSPRGRQRLPALSAVTAGAARRCIGGLSLKRWSCLPS